MKLNFDSKDGVFTVKAENKEEITRLKMSAMDIANLIVNYFDAKIQEVKVRRNETHPTQGHGELMDLKANYSKDVVK